MCYYILDEAFQNVYIVAKCLRPRQKPRNPTYLPLARLLHATFVVYVNHGHRDRFWADALIDSIPNRESRIFFTGNSVATHLSGATLSSRILASRHRSISVKWSREGFPPLSSIYAFCGQVIWLRGTGRNEDNCTSTFCNASSFALRIRQFVLHISIQC